MRGEYWSRPFATLRIMLRALLRRLFPTREPRQPKSVPSATEHNVDQLLARFQPLARPCVRITAKDTGLDFGNDPLPLTLSKFGGLPFLPVGERWPLSDQGKPTVLLAQLNLSEIPPFAPLPDHGLLQIFVSDVFEDFHQEPIIIYRTREELEQPAVDRRQIVYSSPEDFHFSTVHALSFQVSEDRGCRTDEEFEAEMERLLPDELGGGLPDELSDELFDAYDGNGHQIGGYANFTQYDPRTPGRPENFQLLQIDSIGTINIGDAGIIHVFLDPATIRPGRITGGLFYWDCC